MNAPARFHFDEASHVYTLDGVVLPSVTTIIRPLVDFAGIPADVLAAAAARGRAVHKACELDDMDDLDESSVAPELLGYVEAWRAFRRQMIVEILDVERPLYHGVFRFAGTRDVRAKLRDGSIWIIDRKTSASAERWHGVQLAGYALLDDANSGQHDRLGAVMLRADGTYKLEPYGASADMRCFMSLLNVYQWNSQQ